MKLNLKSIVTGRKLYVLLVIAGIVICLIVLFAGKKAYDYTSTDEYCMSCHVHPHAEQSWKLSPHHNNRTGVIVHCSECHLPPEGHGKFFAKAKHGAKDVYGFLFKDSADFNWEQKRTLEAAKHFVYTESCVKCHQNLFPTTLSKEGDDAHLNFITSKEDISCLNCHLDVGHFDPDRKHEHNTDFGAAEEAKEIFTEATKLEEFKSFTEKVPGTSVSFEMVAVPGGKFNMGSPENEPLRDADESPVHPVEVSDFWMGKIEVSWDEYLAFFKETSSQGRKEAEEVSEEVDGITGPTPPWGAPDQGWGKGSRPAITMSWHAANTYCRWLSQVTGKKYRLPTEAEWEYACRGGSADPYPFEGSPKEYTSEGIFKKILGVDTTIINSYVIYKENSPARSQEPSQVKENSFGLKNMLGNISEFCLDYYSPDTYKGYKELVKNPRGPEKGTEHVIRGGSFKSDAKDVRSAARDYTKTKAWLVTDPQMPKSIWWYSDCVDIGFRVVCEPDETIKNK
ncbi:MAG: hypothetical protein A2W90_05270 [Bacteroidetes bacterium GWF2_42_66]|nr:MAG: hypothetical protein A2W92_03445 [Bacteroidetes bacterium GWA2_42_15]OFX95989.1 MAG: hypothetical protein A2W89_02680 [Bacteroidetes bacterium GWE2_42_39]OFY46562.1 MAG: hypothetical protein A2W90_05270 [Bacteroidetes bacterium GWF2_42_66]HBL75582.1 hypothetical protein [Prolixibacteraceae bacterium]HCR91048.1 hypothetical protein [Prolixibacteraceae bacterium]